MAKVSSETHLDVSAEKVWELIGQFNALPSWHPAVENSELEEGGHVRRLSLVGGGTIVERLEKIDDESFLYRYSIIDSPLPVSDYVSELRVRGRNERRTGFRQDSFLQSRHSHALQAVQVHAILADAMALCEIQVGDHPFLTVEAHQPKTLSLSAFANFLCVETTDPFASQGVGHSTNDSGLANAGHASDQEHVRSAFVARFRAFFLHKQMPRP